MHVSEQRDIEGTNIPEELTEADRCRAYDPLHRMNSGFNCLS